MNPRLIRRDALTHHLLLILSFALFCGCEAMVPYHARSAESECESTTVLLETTPSPQSLSMVATHDASQSALHVPPRFLEKRLGNLVAQTAITSTRPPSLWSARTTGIFYANAPRTARTPQIQGDGVTLEVTPALGGFRVQRSLEGTTVTDIAFSIEPIEGAFRVTLESIEIAYSRAKVADTSWRNWWSRLPLLYGFAFDIGALFGASYGDRAIDVHIDVLISATWTDRRGDPHTAPLGVLAWTLLDVPLDGEPLQVGRSSGWIPLVPPSVRGFSEDGITYGKGTFTLTAFVTEQDDFSAEYEGARRSLNEYVDDILSLVPQVRVTPAPQ